MCQDRGLSFVAQVEWEPGETGRTAVMMPNAGFGQSMVDLALAHTAISTRS
jgi:hypothetical protein